MKIEKHFSNISDVREPNKIKHLLSDIIGLSLIATIAGCESYDDIEYFGIKKESWLQAYLKLPNGIPSHDTIERVFEVLDPKEFSTCFNLWVQDVFNVSDEKFLHIDGKCNRRSFDTYHDKKMLHSVSVFAGQNKLSLAQYKVDEKSNEITAIEPLLEMLDIKGKTITIDAMGCQKEIAKYISKKEAHYILAVKDNQKNLHEQIQSAFKNAVIADTFTTLEKEHGRVEERNCRVIKDLRFVDEACNWDYLHSIICITSNRFFQNKETIDTRYFISSHNEKASYYSEAVRSHWGIENSLHWVLDVVFKEDYCRKRKDNAAENFNIIRKMALNIIRTNKKNDKVSLRRARLAAGWDDSYLDNLLKF
jgi:predicted transposase YbfD/YdcC